MLLLYPGELYRLLGASSFISLRLNGVNPILKTNNDSHGNWGGEW